MYTVDYFIKKFEAIPEILWCIRNLHHEDRSCAMGHCGVDEDVFMDSCDSFRGNDESKALIALFKLLPITISNGNEPSKTGLSDYDYNVSYVNDGDADQYKQPTPKARVLAALYDIKAMQEKEQKPERIKTVYVSVPETIKEQSQELIMS